MTPERWQKVEQLYHAALERDPSLRADYLQQACAGDDALRQEVESLLAQGSNSYFLNSPAAGEPDKIIADQQRSTTLVGQQLGSYQVISMLGAGGMGEVYKARDTRLNRTVAIKVLPAHRAESSEFRERFEREARTIASLSHPHICTLYDIGHQDGTDYLVMEYLEGQTLAQRLKKGSLPLDQTLQYAIEIADALDKAHRKGITHRDLKPGNIMLTKSGAKLLDFGLAKWRQGANPGTPLSELPTEKSDVTATGTILGTLQYMAPEQVEGKEADARTDIFAFGVVVYEMATGKKAFEGKTQASLIAKILETNPPAITSLQPMTPPALGRAVKKCLEKAPEDRWQSAKDLADELKWIAGSSEAAEGAVPHLARTFSRRPAILALAAVAVAAASATAMWYFKPVPPLPVTRTVIALPPDQQLDVLDQPIVAISPDGKLIAYVALQAGVHRLFVRAMDAQEARLIPDTEGAVAPFFSPDGQWVGFFQLGSLMKVSVNGGAPIVLSRAGVLGSAVVGATWSSSGNIIFSPYSGGPLQQVPDDGGAVVALTNMGKSDVTHRWANVLPDGKAVLFVAASSPIDARIAVRSIQTGEQRDVMPGGTYPRYAPTGHLIYVQASTLMGVPFDAQKLRVTGAQVPLVDSIVVLGFTGAAQYDISRTGTLVYLSGGIRAPLRNLVWVNRNGKEQILAAPAREYGYPRISPDGKRVAVEVENQIWLYDVARDALSRFTFEGSVNQNPAWTSDGRRISFYSDKEGSPPNIFWQLADGSGGAERLSTSKYPQIPRSWSPDGQFLAFHENNPVTKKDIWVLRLRDRKAEPFLRTPFSEGGATFSPDGHWLPYISDESGRQEVYVQPYPGPGGKWQISTEGGSEPAWNRNGRELFYRAGNKMMSVDVTTAPNFSAGKPKVLFEGKYFAAQPPLAGTAYDVSADGQRFLMVKETEATTSNTQINVVQNWFEELKRKVPVGGK